MKVILFANTDWYLYNFRLPLAQALQDRGDTVLLLSPAGTYADKLTALGFRWQEFPIDRSGANLIKEGLTLIRLWQFYRRERPNLVHHFTVKCVLYGSVAARLTGFPLIVNSMTGLGYIFTGPNKWIKAIVSNLYRLVLQQTWVIFQNPDDQALFTENKLAHPSRMALIHGSGVNTERFRPSPEPTGTPICILSARLLWDKGVGDFVEAANILKQRGVDARFALVGDTDPGNPSAVPAETLKSWQEQNLIEWWGWQENMVDVYSKTNIVCLPSFYGEGVPKTLIEAAACGRALIATDAPGCREIVHHNVNGLLVPMRAPVALADALETLIANPALRQKMAEKGRQMVVEKFDVKKVIKATFEYYDRAIHADRGSDGH